MKFVHHSAATLINAAAGGHTLTAYIQTSIQSALIRCLLMNIRIICKVPQTGGILGPSLTKTGRQMKSQDKNSTHEKKRGPNWSGLVT
jgi:hypothetical protein